MAEQPPFSEWESESEEPSSANASSGKALSPEEMGAVVDEHLAVVYRYAFRLTGQTADAEDITQQTFLIAQTRLGQLRDLDRLRSWLLTVVRRCFLKTCRQRNPLPASNLELELEHLPEDPVDEPIDREALQAALDELPYEFRVIVVMFYFEHASYKEIAATLELPIGTVMSRLSRAKSSLRRLLATTVDSLAGQENSERANGRQRTKPGTGAARSAANRQSRTKDSEVRHDD